MKVNVPSSFHNVTLHWQHNSYNYISQKKTDILAFELKVEFCIEHCRENHTS